MVLRDFLSATISAFSSVLLASLAASQDKIIHERIPGDPWGLTFAKLAGIYDSAMPDPTVAYDPNTESYVVTAAGHDIWDSQDGCAFAYLEMPTGDWSLRVRLEHDFTGPATSSWSKAGLMVRHHSCSWSKYVFYHTTRGQGQAVMAWRDQDKAPATWPGFADIPRGYLSYPYYLRLDRVGDTFTGFHSTHGTSWERGSSYTNDAFAGPVYVGFALTSAQFSVPTTMTFSSFSILSQDGPVTKANAGPDQWVYGGDTVTLDGSLSWKATAWYWEQIVMAGDPVVTLSPSPDPPDGICTFAAPSRDVGYTLTFRLTVTGETGTSTDIVLINVRCPTPPPVGVQNLRLFPLDKGFWLKWDPVFDAESYEVALEAPDLITIWPIEVTVPEAEVRNLPVGRKLAMKVIAKNAKGSGAESELLYYTIMRNIALPAPVGATPPASWVYTVSHFSIAGMNNGATVDNNDSWNGKFKNEDYWGYLWDKPVYFDAVVYYAGSPSYDGGWFTDLTVQYTEDCTSWKRVPNVKIVPDYDFADGLGGRKAFTRYDISFPILRGKGIRIFGSPGGMASFSSIAELEVYGDQTRGAIVVQGIDADVPERTTAKLDGSFTFSTRGAVSHYNWEIVTAPVPVTIQDPNSVIASFEAPGVDEDKVFVFRLTASDPWETGSDEYVHITVKNLATTADAGPDQQVSEGTLVTLDGWRSQTTSGQITYQWTQIGEPKVALDNPTSRVCTFTSPEIWSHTKRLTFQLQVNDGVGGTSTDEVNVTVTNSLFHVTPLAKYYWTDLLHLGQTLTDRFLAPLDQSLDTNDYLAKWGGQANANPMAGDVCDFTDTGITTTINPMIWTPIHDDAGWFGYEAYDNFGQMYHVYIFCPEQREARLRMRFDDEVRVWNNGAVAFSADAWDNGTEGWRNCTLYEGVNSMTLRFEEGGGGNYIAARITDRNDLPYADLLYSLSVPNPLPKAYAVRQLPASYRPGEAVEVKLSVRADTENLPASITIKETIPEGAELADFGGDPRLGNQLTWFLTPPETGIAEIPYTLRVLPDTSGALLFAGTLSYAGVPEQAIYGDNCVYEVPAAPRDATVEILAAGHLSWSPSKSAGVVGYNVYRRTDNGPWEKIAYVTETSYVDESVVPDKTYCYTVSAVNERGAEGAPSSEFCWMPRPVVIREAEDYDEAFYRDIGGPGRPPLPIPAPYHPDDCNIRPGPEEGQWVIVWPSPGDWWKYNLYVPEYGWVKVELRVSSPGRGEVAVFWDENLLGRLAFKTGGWDVYQYFLLEEQVVSSVGRHSLKIQLTAGEMNFDKIAVGFNWTPPRRRVLFQDDFEGYGTTQEVVAGGKWTIKNSSGDPAAAWQLWNTDGPKLREETPDLWRMAGNYMITDSDLAPEAQVDEELITSEIDCTDYCRLRLDFRRNYRAYLEDFSHLQVADVDIHIYEEETGRWSDWVNLMRFDKSIFAIGTDPAIDSSSERIDFSAYDGKKIQLRWHFHDALWDYWFAIDDVKLSGEQVVKPPPAKRLITVTEKTVTIPLEPSPLDPSRTESPYIIQYTDDLLEGVWQDAPGTWPSTELEWSDDITGIRKRFYRILVW